MMSYAEFSDYLHQLRAARTGRPRGAAMRLAEVWNCAIDCKRNGISEIRYHETENLPSGFDGAFVRLDSVAKDRSIAAIYVDRNLPAHWKEFVAIKEMMHCWSPGHTFVGDATQVRELVHGLTRGKFTPVVAADSSAVLAAAEVILPHYKIEHQLAVGQSYAQIAHTHGLHPEVVEEISRFDLLHLRKNGSFF